MKCNNILRQKARLLNKVEAIRNDKQKLIEFNNNTILPLYNTIKSMIERRIAKEDFSGFNLLNTWVEDFNVLHDIDYFLCDLSRRIKIHLNEIQFNEHEFLIID